MTPDTASDLVAKLGAQASPLPYVLDGFNLHDAGTWMIAVMARGGNPSTKSSPEATKAYVVLAVNSFPLVLKALEPLLTDFETVCAHDAPTDPAGSKAYSDAQETLATVAAAAKEAL